MERSPRPCMVLVTVSGWMQKFLSGGLLATFWFMLLLLDHCFFSWIAATLVIFHQYLSTKQQKRKVIVFCIPPHSTHKTQPLDKGVFGPLKKAWREECHSYMVDNPGKVVTRYQFSLLFNHAWMKAMTPHNIMSDV